MTRVFGSNLQLLIWPPSTAGEMRLAPLLFIFAIVKWLVATRDTCQRNTGAFRFVLPFSTSLCSSNCSAHAPVKLCHRSRSLASSKAQQINLRGNINVSRRERIKHWPDDSAEPWPGLPWHRTSSFHLAHDILCGFLRRVIANIQ